MHPERKASHPRFRLGDRVRVAELGVAGHVRTPIYIRDKVGAVIEYCGRRRNPERLAYGHDGLPERDLYLLRFRQRDIWPTYPNDRDTLENRDL